MSRYYTVDNKEKLSNISSISSLIVPFIEQANYQNTKLKEAFDNLKNIDSDLLISEYNNVKNLGKTIGTEVHNIIDNSFNLIKNGNYDKLINIPKGSSNYAIECVKAFQSFIKEHKVNLLLNEIRVFKHNYYAGTYDLLLKRGKEVWLADIKTTEFKEDTLYFSESYLIQLALYFDCIKYIYDNEFIRYSITRVENKINSYKEVSLSKEHFEYYKQLIKKPKAMLIYLCRKTGRYKILEFNKKDLMQSIKRVALYFKYKENESKLRKCYSIKQGYKKYE